MTLEQLMAFTGQSDHARQEQVWEAVQRSHAQEPTRIPRVLRMPCGPPSRPGDTAARRSRWRATLTDTKKAAAVSSDTQREEGAELIELWPRLDCRQCRRWMAGNPQLSPSGHRIGQIDPIAQAPRPHAGVRLAYAKQECRFAEIAEVSGDLHGYPIGWSAIVCFSPPKPTLGYRLLSFTSGP